MDTATIEKLVRTPAGPAVSILCPLDRARPGTASDTLRLERLRGEAVDGLRRGFANGDVDAIIGGIDDAFREIDLAHPPAAVAVFVSAGERLVLELPVAVPERVAVGEQFAVRDLLAAVQRVERARVVVLSQHRVRYLDAAGGSLTEVSGGGFPMSFERLEWTATPHRDLPIGERARAETVRNEFREVDRALQQLQADERLPVVVVGTERDIAFFREITAAAGDIVGMVTGNHLHEDAPALAAVVAPVLDRHFEAQQAAARSRVGKTAARDAVGIDAVWNAAREGRGHELVVEETFRYPARVVGGRLEPAGDDAPDAVDAIVSEVLRHGGRVVTVAAGALAEYGHIALIPRY